METWDRISLVVWCVLAARTVAFRGNWQGYLWTPSLHADSWYRLTPHIAFIPYKRCIHIWYTELLLAGIAILFPVERNIYLIAIYTRLLLTRIWWPLFLELGAPWKYIITIPICTICIDAMIYKIIYDAKKQSLYAVHIPLTCIATWLLYMNCYAACVIGKPITRIQYKARTSRLPTV